MIGKPPCDNASSTRSISASVQPTVSGSECTADWRRKPPAVREAQGRPSLRPRGLQRRFRARSRQHGRLRGPSGSRAASVRCRWARDQDGLGHGSLRFAPPFYRPQACDQSCSLPDTPAGGPAADAAVSGRPVFHGNAGERGLRFGGETRHWRVSYSASHPRAGAPRSGSNPCDAIAQGIGRAGQSA